MFSKYITRKEPSGIRPNINEISGSIDYGNIGKAIGEAMINSQNYIAQNPSIRSTRYDDFNQNRYYGTPVDTTGIMANDLQADNFAPIYDDSIDDDKALSYVNFNQDEENPWYANLMEYTRNNLPNIVARGALMQAGMGAGAMAGLGLPGILMGLFAGAKAPFRDTPSMQAFNQLTPAQRQSVGSIYGQGGIMQGYNPISAYGRGPRGAIQNRISNIQNRKAAQTAISRQRVKDLQAALNQVGGGDGGSGNQGGGFDNTFQESYDWSADD